MAFAWLAAACDVPSSPPEWDTTWVVPGDDVTLDVTSLLPGAVTVSEDESVFILALDPTVFGRSLADVCPECAALDGTTAPKPAFSAEFGGTIDLPEDVVSATVVSGVVELRVMNGWNFDPIQPGGGATGTIVMTVRNGGRVLAADTLDGAVESFPAATTRTLTFELEPGVVSGTIHVDLSIDSPAGDPIFVDSALRFDAEAVPGESLLSEAEVDVADRSVDLQAVELDFEGVDDELTSRVRGGALRLEVSNPFDVEGMLQLELTSAEAAVRKEINVVPGESSPRVEFTGDEVRAIVGHTSTFGGSGVVTSISGPVGVTPSQELTIHADLELVVGPKED